MPSVWILGSLKKDFSFFYFPALLSVLIVLLAPSWSGSSLLFAFIATALIDSGHVYTTFWRWGDKALASFIYPIILLGVFVTISTAYYFGLRQILWSGVVYLTVFHHIRQVYGFSRWYERLNQRYSRVNSIKVYLLSIVPFIAFHFRDLNLSYYSTADLVMLPNAQYFQWMLKCYLAVLSFVLLHEIYLWRKQIKEPNRVCYFALICLTYGYSFLVGKSLVQVLFPLLVIHGVAYLAIMAQHMTNTRRMTMKKASALILMTAFIFGTTESYFEENMDQFIASGSEWVTALLIGAYLTPLLAHYVLDAFLWRRRAIAPLANK